MVDLSKKPTTFIFGERKPGSPDIPTLAVKCPECNADLDYWNGRWYCSAHGRIIQPVYGPRNKENEDV